MALRRPRVPHLLLDVRQERVISNVAKRGCTVNRLRKQAQLAPMFPFLEGDIQIKHTAFCAALTTASAILALISRIRSRRG